VQEIYLDHASTAGARPPEVLDALVGALRDMPANPGRGCHRLAIAARRAVERTREQLAALLHAEPSRICFTKSATEALNLALYGYLQPGDRVLLSRYEHDAVALPLAHLRQTRGLQVEDLAPPPGGGIVDLDALAERLRRPGRTLVVVSAVSNVTGQRADVEGIAKICRSAGARLLVDAAQAAGVVELDVRVGVHLLALSGHKNLHGPPGVGALYVGHGEAVEPLLRGATGSEAADAPTGWPETTSIAGHLPACYEAGTLNVCGIVALGAALEALQRRGLPAVAEHHRRLRRRLCEQLEPISGLRLHGSGREQNAGCCIVSLSLAGWSPRELELELDRRGICARGGLHGARRAHATLGTLEGGGALRLSASSFTSEAMVDRACEVLGSIAAG
jgi:cysteine desulfurase/selenocysteine lyase